MGGGAEMMGVECTCNCPAILSAGGLMFMLTALFVGILAGFFLDYGCRTLVAFMRTRNKSNTVDEENL